MHEFIYSADAVAVAANFTGPQALKGVWASCALPIIGGDADALETSFTHPVVSFGRAESWVRGFKVAADIYRTETSASVSGLRVQIPETGALLTGNIDVTVVFTYTRMKNDDQLVVDISPGLAYAGLNIVPRPGGAPLEPAIEVIRQMPLDPELPNAIGETPGPQMKRLREVLKNKREFKDPKGGRAVRHKHGEVFLTSLMDDPLNGAGKTRLRWDVDTQEHGFIRVDGLGKVYLAEWVAEPYRQTLTMLRILLDDPGHNYRGQIVIGDPGSNSKPSPGSGG